MTTNALPHTGPPVKVSGPTFEQRQKNGKKSGKWRVRWRILLPGSTEPKTRSEGGFATKTLAEQWANRIHSAHSGADGWHFNAHGLPAQASATSISTVTILEDIEVFVDRVGRIEWVSDQHYDKQTSVLARAVAHLLHDSTLTRPLLDAWERQNRSQKDRPEPTSDLDWAGRYLRDRYLHRGEAEPVSPEDEAGLGRGRQWLLDRSLTRDAVTPHALAALHGYLHFKPDGSARPAATSRTYWGVIRRVMIWFTDEGFLTSNPAQGFSHRKRDLDSQRVDPRRIPNQPTLWRIAIAVASRAGRITEGVLVLVMAYAALRIGEACDLRRRDVVDEDEGGMWLSVATQWDPPGNGDETNPAPSRPTKGHTTEASARRPVYIGRRVARLLRWYMANYVDDAPGAPLFPGKRSARVEPDTFRQNVWKPVIGEMFSDDDPLAGLHPHDLRRTGIAMWLRQGVPTNNCAEWGGWKSRKVMLDVYDAFLPDDDELAMWAVEGGRRRSAPRRARELTDQARSEFARAILDLRHTARSLDGLAR